MTYNGELRDGTRIVGPFTAPPGNAEAGAAEVQVEGQTYWVQHTGPPLSAPQIDELKEWVSRHLPAH